MNRPNGLPSMLMPIIVVAVATCWAATASATAAPAVDQQRFLAAEKAIQRGDSDTFHRLRAELGDYPLVPYLDYADLSTRLSTASEKEVAAFIDRHQDTPLASRLRGQWLDHLATQRRWAEFLTLYAEDGNVSRQCHHLQAKLETGQSNRALPEVAPIWLHGKSRPKACDPVFSAWAGAGQRTGERVWQRVEKAMAIGEWRLANYLKRYLPATERPKVDRWVALYRDPMLLASGDADEASHPYREIMLAQVTRRLARRDGPTAMTAWQRLRARYSFDETLARETEQYILRNLVRDPGDAVYRFVASVEVGPDDTDAHEARILAALQREDWPRVHDWIAALPDATRDETRWRYWYGRAMQATGDSDGAHAAFSEAARDRSYYGFLAADQVGAEYHLLHAETPVAAADLASISRLAGIERTRELFALERWYDGRREWHWATRDLPAPLLKAAAKLAQPQRLARPRHLHPGQDRLLGRPRAALPARARGPGRENAGRTGSTPSGSSP
jgi:soluble lytic murein transglycosylase